MLYRRCAARRAAEVCTCQRAGLPEDLDARAAPPAGLGGARGKGERGRSRRAARARGRDPRADHLRAPRSAPPPRDRTPTTRSVTMPAAASAGPPPSLLDVTGPAARLGVPVPFVRRLVANAACGTSSWAATCASTPPTSTPSSGTGWFRPNPARRQRTLVPRAAPRGEPCGTGNRVRLHRPPTPSSSKQTGSAPSATTRRHHGSTSTPRPGSGPPATSTPPASWPPPPAPGPRPSSPRRGSRCRCPPARPVAEQAGELRALRAALAQLPGQSGGAG